MKILMVADVPNWAIDALCQLIIKHNPHHQIRLKYVHPRDAKLPEKVSEFKKIVEQFQPDLIHIMYYRSGIQLIEELPELKEYPIIVSHQNQRTKALFMYDWKKFGVDMMTCATEKCKNMLEEKYDVPVTKIPFGIDLNEFSYSDKEPDEFMLGSVGRAVRWKGLKEISEVATELNKPLQIMGYIDKADYWNEVDRTMFRYDFWECKDEERIDCYRNMTIYIGNSKDGYEEGTLGYLEAMAAGVPVITTPSGMAADLGVAEENCLMVDFEDKEQLKEAVKRLSEDKDLRQKLRKNAWNTIKNYPEERMALEYSKLYNQVVIPKKKLVSVIIPATYDRVVEVTHILQALEDQTYKKIEAVIVWDESKKINNMLKLDDWDNKYSVKEIWTEKDGYNLAMARNLGAIEAEGYYLMFNDSRMEPDKLAIQTFVAMMEIYEKKKIWLFGDKGAQKRSFVENFSFIERFEFFKFGMCNERIDGYGGASQEIRTRWAFQGGEFVYVEGAVAKELKSANKMDDNKRKSIIKMKFLLHKIYGGSRY